MRNELLSRIPRANGEEMIVCPICSGAGVITSEKRLPQGEPKVRTCPACYGVGEVEEVKTDKQTITIYKAHGIYATEREHRRMENTCE